MKIRFRPLIPFPMWLATVVSLTSGVFGQSYIRFDNRVPGVVVAPVYGAEPGNPALLLRGNSPGGYPPGATIYQGPLLSGTNYTAQLWAGPAGTPENQLMPIATTTFRTGSGAGSFVVPTGPVVLPGVAPGARVTLQVRAWDNKGGRLPTWAHVQANITPRGVSDVFLSAPLSASTSEATTLAGLTSFNITCLSCGTPPAIWQQPASASVARGATATFSVGVYGEYPTYQWQRDGTAIPGATGQMLSITSAQATDAGVYSVAVSNSLGGVISSNATLTVSPGLLSAPHLTAERKFSFLLTGETGRVYLLEVSTNLPSWSPRAMLTNSAGQLSFTETNTASDRARFYRARPQP